MVTSQQRVFSVGDCVILNDCEQPSAKMVAVVVGVCRDKDYKGTYQCQYLNALAILDSHNDPPMVTSLDRATRIEDFGVKLVFDEGRYHCERVGESVATYPDGWPRKWQDSELNHSWPMRADVFRRIGSA